MAGGLEMAGDLEMAGGLDLDLAEVIGLESLEKAPGLEMKEALPT